MHDIETLPTGPACLQKVKIDDAQEDIAYWEDMSERLYHMEEECKRDWWASWLQRLDHTVALAVARFGFPENFLPPAHLRAATASSTTSVTTAPNIPGTACAIASQTNRQGLDASSATSQTPEQTDTCSSDVDGQSTNSESNISVSEHLPVTARASSQTPIMPHPSPKVTSSPTERNPHWHNPVTKPPTTNTKQGQGSVSSRKT